MQVTKEEQTQRKNPRESDKDTNRIYMNEN